jgi:hypothetical protein
MYTDPNAPGFAGASNVVQWEAYPHATDSPKKQKRKKLVVPHIKFRTHHLLLIEFIFGVKLPADVRKEAEEKVLAEWKADKLK